MNILFVCSGNTCRSPMAAALARSMGVLAESAGSATRNGQPATPQAVKAMKEMGIDLREHRSRMLRDVDFRDFDAIVCMTTAHANAVHALYEQQRPRRWWLRLLRALIPTRTPRIEIWDMPDPFGASIETYRATARELQDGIAAMLEGKHNGKR